MMEHNWSIAGRACAAMCAAALFGVTGAALAADSNLFEVSVTNLTAGQAFTPVLVASHKAGVTLFTLGQPASFQLEVLAEAGDTGPLAAMLAAKPEVLEVTVETQGEFDHVSVAAMLIPTNDGFFAINGVPGPAGNTIATFYSPAHDAGTEADDELCANIPGPPTVCRGEGFTPAEPGMSTSFIFIAVFTALETSVPRNSAGEIRWRW